MTQETRRDRRVKIVSLNVRYKSATVDEFIENHAHDVSRGGIYIKTANPFPPGTLLKFEIRLASDQAVIAGVGRVVWKRDPAQAKGERPAGMGVKFIKIDEPSKAVIDRLANSRADAGKAYEAEPEGVGTSDPPPRPNPAAMGGEPRISTRPGMGATQLAPKATVLGLGAAGPSVGPHDATALAPTPALDRVTPAPTAAVAARPAGGMMFPKGDATRDAPPKQEQTVMKQAAELLEEALREAGGSMEEIGTNPLFAGGSKPPGQQPPRPSSDRPSSGKIAEAKTAEARTAEAKSAEIQVTDLKEPETKGVDEAAKARAMVAELAPAPVRASSSPPARTVQKPPIAKVVIEQEPTSPGLRQAGRGTDASTATSPKRGAPGVVVGLIVLAAAVAAVAMYRDKLFGGGTPTTVSPSAASAPSETIPNPPVVASPPPPHETPTAPPVVASEKPREVPAPSEGASAAASTAGANAASPSAAPAPAGASAPASSATPTAAKPVVPAAPPAVAKPSPPVAQGQAAPVVAAPPKPKPPPLPKQPSTDNPY